MRTLLNLRVMSETVTFSDTYNMIWTDVQRISFVSSGTLTVRANRKPRGGGFLPYVLDAPRLRAEFGEVPYAALV